MISATVEAHGEPLTSKTCDTNHLWPCELKASGNETGTTLFKRLRLSLESPGTENTAAHCMGIRKKVQIQERHFWQEELIKPPRFFHLLQHKEPNAA